MFLSGLAVDSGFFLLLFLFRPGSQQLHVLPHTFRGRSECITLEGCEEDTGAVEQPVKIKDVFNKLAHEEVVHVVQSVSTV